MKQALLLVSFGTAAPGAQNSITAVENALIAAAPDRTVFRAYTSPTIRRILARRGVEIPDLTTALETLAAQGYEDVALQPTHVIPGFEYDRIKAEADRFAPKFAHLRLGTPLLYDVADLTQLAEHAAQCWLPEEGALVLLGHGTEHRADLIYPALAGALRCAGADNALVGTVEGWPGFDAVLAMLRRGGWKQVCLRPLLLTAGEHARNDMAGENPESWKSRLEAAGFTVSCCLEGMGTDEAVQKLYCRHLRAIL